MFEMSAMTHLMVVVDDDDDDDGRVGFAFAFACYTTQYANGKLSTPLKIIGKIIAVYFVERTSIP